MYHRLFLDTGKSLCFCSLGVEGLKPYNFDSYIFLYMCYTTKHNLLKKKTLEADITTNFSAWLLIEAWFKEMNV